MTDFEEQQGGHPGHEENAAGHQIRKGEGIALEVVDAPKYVRVLLSRTGKEAAKCRPEDAANAPYQRHK